MAGTEISDAARPRGDPRRIVDIEKHEPRHITTRAFADYLAVDRKTVIRWIKWGRLPAYRIPSVSANGREVGEWRIATTEAIAFMRKYKFEPGHGIS